MKILQEKEIKNRIIPIYFLIIALLGLVATQATAASFDCKKAASWVEKTVCSNPELSKLDDEMAKAYSNALASLSPEGQKETIKYQKQWLKEISPYCEARMKIGFINDKSICLKNGYEERIGELKQILIKFPDRMFRNVHVSNSESYEDCRYLFVKRKLNYPQIENPRNENEKFWNTLIFKKANDDFKEDSAEGECTNIHNEYTVSFSNKHLISFQSEQFYFTHGAPHGYANIRSLSWLLESKRELQASDLFDDKTSWRNKLAALVIQKLKDDKKETYIIHPSIIMNNVSSPSHWVISKNGVGIQFDEYDLGSRIAPLIKIDWKVLDPYISKYGHSLIAD